MLKLEPTKQQSLTVYNASQPDPEPGRRFIIPVTNPEADLTAVAQRVWELANASRSRVQLIGLCSDAMHELEFRRALAIVSAMVNYGSVSAESEIVFGRDRVRMMKSRLQEGDTVVCWDQQHSELPHADFGVPIYFIPGFKPGKTLYSNLLPRAMAWIGSIAIIVLFFFMQVQIEHFAQGWATIMELLSVAGEFGLIWFLNNLLG